MFYFTPPLRVRISVWLFGLAGLALTVTPWVWLNGVEVSIMLGAAVWIGQHARLEIQADTVAWHTLFFIVPDLPPSRWMTQRSWLHLSDALLMAFIPYAIAGWGLAIFWARLG